MTTMTKNTQKPNLVLQPSVDDAWLKTQVKRCLTAMLVGSLGVLGTGLFLLFGPELSRETGLLLTGMLVGFFSLFVLGLLTCITPLLEAAALRRYELVLIQKENYELAVREKSFEDALEVIAISLRECRSSQASPTCPCYEHVIQRLREHGRSNEGDPIGTLLKCLEHR